MPSKPTNMKTELNNTSAEILNAVRNSASPAYQQAVPAVQADDLATLRAYGDAMMSYEPLMNEFIGAINRISMVLITSKMYTNPLGFFKRGMLEFGETVEELFVEIAKGHQYNIEESEEKQYKREQPTVLPAFHKLNYKTFYKQTIQNEDLRQAFLSWDGVSDLIAKIVNAMYSAASYDEQNMMLYMVAHQLLAGHFYILNAGADAKATVQAVKAVSNDMVFMSKKYNEARVHNFTAKEDQIVLITGAFDADMGVNVLASAFNITEVQFMGQRVLVPSFDAIDLERVQALLGEQYQPLTEEQLDSLKNIPMVIVDRDWSMIFDNMNKFTEKYNGEGLYWNYWYHVWKIFSHSPFANAVAVVQGESLVNSVTITPEAATLSVGASMQLTEDVQTTGFANKAVNWTSDNDLVEVAYNGMVTVKKGATGTATITATSVADPTKSGTATITIS